MTRLLIAGNIHADGLALLRAEPGLQIDIITDPGAALPMEKLATCDALLIRYGVITATMAAQMPNLRIVSRHGVGCDNLPVAELAARGIPVTTVGPVSAITVAEQVLAMLLALVKQLQPYDAATRGGNWAIRESLAVGELAGRRLLILGFGRIGHAVARRALAFDMEVMAFDPFVPADAIRAAGCVPVADWRATLPQVDAISLHLPASAETRGMIGAAELAAMKPTAMVINAARGGMIDETALFAALSGRMAQGGAGLDCFAVEPVPLNLPLLALPNVVLSPHSAALSREGARRMGMVAAQNILDALHGRIDPALVFNRDALLAAGYRING